MTTEPVSPTDARPQIIAHATSMFASLAEWLPDMEWRRDDVPLVTMFATAARVVTDNGADPKTIRALQQIALLCHWHKVTWADLDGAAS